MYLWKQGVSNEKECSKDLYAWQMLQLRMEIKTSALVWDTIPNQTNVIMFLQGVWTPLLTLI